MAKTKYNEDFPLLAEGYARQGLTDEQIAHNLGISHDTFYRYMKEHEEFSEAVKRGKRPVDIEVENELLRLCLGFESTDRVVEYYPPSPDGSPPEVKSTKLIKKHVAGDIRAIQTWLYNRKPKEWSNRKQIDIKGTIEQRVNDMTPEERERKLIELKEKMQKANKRLAQINKIQDKMNAEDAVIISEHTNK